MSPSCRGVRGAPSRPPAHPVGGGRGLAFGGPVVEERPGGGRAKGAVRTRPCAALSPPATGRGHLALAGLPALWSLETGQFRPPRAPPAAPAGRGLGLPPVPPATGPGPAPRAGPGRERGERRPLRACPPPGTPGARFQRAERRLGPSLDGGGGRAARGRSRARCFRAEARARRAAGEEAAGARGEPSLRAGGAAPLPAAAPGLPPRARAGHFLTSLSKRLSILLSVSVPRAS